MKRRDGAGLEAEAEIRSKLELLDTAQEPAITQERADALLARIAWSRLCEPGDGTAGAMLASLGAKASLAKLIEGVAPRKVKAEVAAAGTDLDEQRIAEAFARWRPRLDRAATLGDIDRAVSRGMKVAVPGDAVWPTAALSSLGAHMPVMMWMRGDPRLLTSASLSVVGARAATGYGSHVTADIVDGVCGTGLTIVSGAAYGIDAVAHRTALAAQAPTIAVLAGGADRHYPAAHDALIERIAREGLVCAEMIPGSAPTRWRFRQRNRIIAAISPATLVTEAGVRSGTLNTAGHAAELGRALGAVPGPVSSAASAGCHTLIREYGAALVTNAREACELVGIDDQLDIFAGTSIRAGSNETAQGKSRLPPGHERVLDALPLRGRRTFEEIVRRAGMDPTGARGALAELEILELVRRCETPGDSEPKWALQRRQ